MKLKSLIFCILLFLSSNTFAQAQEIKVLFLGNSYTYVNDLPELISDLLTNTNLRMTYDMYCPGGYTLEGHSRDAAVLEKIKLGNWDFVVLQEQSQVPTIDYYRYNSMYPAFMRLTDSIKRYNPCAKVVSFVTWGRRFGGMQCNGGHCSPDFVDFNHMQDSLTSAYSEISKVAGAYIAPVGVAWKKALSETNIVLHSSDDSHPTLAGSYLAACIFHSVFWGLSPVGYDNNTSLDYETALYLQQLAAYIVFDTGIDWNLNVDQPHAAFDYTISGNNVSFINNSYTNGVADFFWDFGDGNSSTAFDPQHQYKGNGEYEVSLKVNYCTKSDFTTQIIKIQTVGYQQYQTPVNHNTVLLSANLYPNPTKAIVYVDFENVISRISFEFFHANGTKFKKYVAYNTNKVQLDLSDYPNGVYILRIIDLNTQQVIVKKVVKHQ